MWEKYELGNEDFLWTCIPFMGGISGQQQAPCGAVTAGSIALGLRHKCSISDKEKADAARKTIRNCAEELVKSFNETFGGLSCMEVVGIDFSKPGAYKEFLASGVWKDRCVKYVEFVIEKLYEFEDRQDTV